MREIAVDCEVLDEGTAVGKLNRRWMAWIDIGRDRVYLALGSRIPQQAGFARESESDPRTASPCAIRYAT